MHEGEFIRQNPVKWNEATVVGDTKSDACRAALSLPIRTLCGWSSKHPSGSWQRWKPSLEQLVEDVFSRHPVSRRKDGHAIVFAEAAPASGTGDDTHGSRKKDSIRSISVAGFDIDAGASLTAVKERLADLGFFAIVYTTHSHGKSASRLAWEPAKGEPTEDAVASWATERGFSNPVLAGVEVSEGGAVEVVIRHDPIDKFRVLLPLEAPFELKAGDARVRRAREQEWHERLMGFAAEKLAVEIDPSGCDINRLFYLPRHPASQSGWETTIFAGRALCVEDMPRTDTPPRGAGRKTGGSSLRGFDGKRPLLSDGFDLIAWDREFGDRFLAVDFIEALGWDVRSGGASRDRAEVECPNDDAHSNAGTPGDRACWVRNGDGDDNFKFTCRHAHCRKLGRLDMLVRLEGFAGLPDGWPSFSRMLCDESFYLMGDDEGAPDWESYVGAEALSAASSRPLPGEGDVIDDEETEPAVSRAAVPLTRADWSSSEDATRTVAEAGLGPNSADADVKALIMRALNAEIDTGGLARLWLAANAAGIPLGKRDWQSMVKAARQDRSARQRLEEDPDAGPNIAQADFKAQVAYALDRLQDDNATKPKLFRYGSEVAEIASVRETGQSSIQTLDFRTFHARLSRVTDFRQQVGDDRTRGVRTPEDVASDLYAERELPVPYLRGIARAPLFGADGNLIATPGYDGGSGLFYMPPDGLNVPPLPDTITDDVLREARRLLVEELLGDFMFDGVSREALVKAALGDEVPPPSLLNLIGFMLEQFVRPLIEGPVLPMLITKPIRGAGASLLMEAVQIVVDGRPSSRPLSKSEDERRKTVFTALLAGAATIYWDNVVGSVDSQVLAQLFSEDTFTDRELGRSAERQLPVRASFALSGNRPTFSDELRRRLSLVNLDPQSHEPEKRVGFRHRNLPAWAREHRGELVWALLVLVRNWLDRGRPAPRNAPAIGRYESYVDTIGGIIEAAAPSWTTWQGNRAALNEIASNDEEEDIALLVETWHSNATLRTSATARDVAELADANELGLPVKRVSSGDAVKFAPRSMAAYLKQHLGRIFALSDGKRVKLLQSSSRRADGHPWSLVATA